MLRSSGAKLVTYTGESINVVGAAVVTVKYNEQVATLPLIITSGTGPSLLGRDWLSVLKLDWKEIFVLQSPRRPSGGIRQRPGNCPRYHSYHRCRSQRHTVFHKARPLPYTLREKVERELKCLQEQGVIEPVKFSH